VRAPRFFRSFQDAPIGDLTGPPRGEAGADGDSWLLDMLGGGPDVNPELSGLGKFPVYDEMRKTDASVKSMLMLLKLPVRAASWGLNPRTKGDPLDLLIRDFVACNLGLDGEDGWLDMSWSETLMQGLQMLEFGPSFEELVWGDVRPWYDQDGDTHLVRPLERLAPRPATSIQSVRRDRGRILEVRQSTPNTRPIPGDKVVHMLWEREGDRWDGVSVLRPAWGPWRLKKALMVAAGIGWDRFASGLPVVYHPDTSDGAERAKAIGRNIRQHERGYVHIPKQAGASKDDADFLVDLLNGATTLADPVPLLRFFSEQIAEAGLQQAMRQGLGQTGARATAEVQIDPYYLAVESIAEYLRMERSRQVIRKLVEVNFGAEAAENRTPVLTVSKIQAKNVQVLADAISLLAPLGFVVTSHDAVDDIHEALSLPVPDWDELGDHGVDRARLEQMLRDAGLDTETLATVVAALPDGMGVARNRVEGNGLPYTAAAG
jgi:hypothetical protein